MIKFNKHSLKYNNLKQLEIKKRIINYLKKRMKKRNKLLKPLVKLMIKNQKLKCKINS